MLKYGLYNSSGKEIPLCTTHSVIHFYQGCDILVKDNDGWILDTLEVITYMTDRSIEVWGKQVECVPLREVKLLLKRIEDMSEDEETDYFELCKQVLHLKNPDDEKENMLTTADSGESFAWLIENKFDCFRLIPRAIAFDLNNLPKKIKIIIDEANKKIN